ncbi:MFS transporter [Streptomyces sp. NBC_01216]|uniref:MFS transporter n=1 Tax=unclassified Streptomyces TaxID=2593676 RepID=UPI002E133B27|nr:MFS transporter [Streptomyces sp. NBC_01216]
MTRSRHLTLVCSVGGAALVALDGTVLTVAQPALRHDLDAGIDEVQWTSTGYLIAVASLLVYAGRLGDRYGHRRIFALGTLGFGAASAALAAAPDIGWVIALRVVQGVFGALLQPATLGMLRAAFPAVRLAMPIAVRTSAIGLAAVVGPVVGGSLVSAYGWRSVFTLTAVPALMLGLPALFGPAPGPAHPRSAARPSPDLPGACLLAVTLAGLVHALVTVPRSGATPGNLLVLGVAVPAAVAFVRHEARAAHPLVPPEVLLSRPVVAAIAVLLAASAALFGSLFVATHFLQGTLGLDPLHSALWSLPLAALMILGAPAAAVLQRRAGPRRTTVSGAALLSLGVLLFSRLDATTTAAQTGVCFVLLGAGFGTVMVTATAVVVHRAPESAAGVAGGLQQTAMNIGPALGVAVAALLLTLDPGVGFVPAMGTALTALATLGLLGAVGALALPGRTPSERNAEPTVTGTGTGARDRAPEDAGPGTGHRAPPAEGAREFPERR